MKAGLSVLCSWSPFEISRGDLLSASYQRIIFSIRGFFFSCQRFHQKHRDCICVCVCEATGVRPQSVASGICSDTAATKQSRVRVGFQKNKTKPKPFFLWRPWGFRELRQSVHKQTNTVAKSTYGTWSCTAGRAGSSSPSWFCSRAAWRILRGCKQAQFQRCQSLVCGTWDRMKTHTHRAVLHHIRRQINHSITTTTTETFIFLKLLHSGVTTRGHLPPSHPAELFKLKP